MGELGVWNPLIPEDVPRVFEALDVPWWIAGAWAIDAFLEREAVRQSDIEIGVLRDDQIEVQEALAGWDLQAVDPPGQLRPWRPGEELPESITEVWCRPAKDAVWGLRLSLEESDGEHWEFRWMPSISRPFAAVRWERDGVPYLAVELQLLHEAGKRSPQSEIDFNDCLPRLSEYQRRSLALMLRIAHPGHPWIALTLK